MRRGHSGIGGWRNENPRHFRPRGSGFRPSRGYGLMDTPRFPPLGPRLPRGPPPFANQLNAPDLRSSDHHDRRRDNRPGNQYRLQDRTHHPNQRSVFPLVDRLRQSSDHVNPYQDQNYYENTQRDPHINSMGDIDDRPASQPSNLESFRGRPAWSHTPDIRRYFIDNRSQNQYHKSNKQYDKLDSNKLPILEYDGHRPPSSDHYGGNSSSSIDTSNSFSRSIDDTVDIVRRRLQNRSESQSSRDQVIDHKDEDLRLPSTSQSYQNPSEPQPVKKRMQRQRHRNVDSNCDKMKTKIVHELFKMDKGRIHKLMDNPSSSTKFEYAISSLITESQNSLNKHMRSVAEKSLSTSEDFIRNDKNTIYEDTFMKQMQYILDPQDTVLLEDIKPLVMEELSKVLQLNEYDQPFQVADEHQQPHFPPVQEQQIYEDYNPNQNYDYNPNQSYHYQDYENTYYDQVNSPAAFEDFNTSNSNVQTPLQFSPEPEEKPQLLFERRSKKKSADNSLERSYSSEERSLSRTHSKDHIQQDVRDSKENLPTFAEERRPSRRSRDSRHSEDKSKDTEPQVPLFDTNAEQFSEEDDPFAELDKQYHVAVDHTFMDTYELSSPQQTPSRNTPKNNSTDNNYLTDKSQTPTKPTVSIKQEIDNQLLDMAKSPIKLTFVNKNGSEAAHKSRKSSVTVKREPSPTRETFVSSEPKIPPLKHGGNAESTKESKKETEKSENTEVSSKSSVSTSSRKRSIDQRPSHRKEKRKKSETSQSDTDQQTVNKSSLFNVYDSVSKDKKQYSETAKVVSNFNISKNDSSKEVPKKVDPEDKSYSDKYVRRKEPQRKKDGEEKKRQRSISSSHSIVSPKDSAHSTHANKSESKKKLQSIDMFVEQPRKPASVHQAHRNTALSPNTPLKSIDLSKSKQTPKNYSSRKFTPQTVGIHASERVQSGHKKFQVKETQTNESKSSTSRFCQTEKKKTHAKAVQTDHVKIDKPSKTTDAFERMKEIDLEIQVLLQEKFKLYSSLESNASCPNTMQATLGMTVLNVPITEEPVSNVDSTSTSEEDAIVEDFTSIPVEELEQIAMESVEHTSKQSEKRTRRNKVLAESRQSSASPTVKRSNRKAKTPNISLLEQIITDDRPIEDIISLDDYEKTPVKSKKKGAKQTAKKKEPKRNKPMSKQVLTNLLLFYGIKECYVLLERNDFSMYQNKTDYDQELSTVIEESVNEEKESEKAEVVPEVQVEVDRKSDVHKNEEDTAASAVETVVVEDTVVENDLQIDMMDVSEDIIIGDICEVKSGEDKEADRMGIAINEDIILDNSQATVPTVYDSPLESVCRMYDYSTDENLRRDSITVTGRDAVLAIEPIDNNFIAACLDGNVYYYSNDGQLLSTLKGSNLAVTCLTIVRGKYETTVYTGSLDSRIRYYDLETGMEKGPECNVLSPIQTMDRAWDTIFVGTRTGFVLQFECKNNMLIPVSTVKFSDQSILALRAMKEGPRKVLLVAARFEDVTVKDAQTGLLLRTLEGPKMTVYTLLYEEGKVYCGTSSHQIHVFDYTSGSHTGIHEGGKGTVCIRVTGGLLFAGCYDGCVYIYRDGEPRPLAQLRGPGLMLLSLAVLGSKIIAGYKDRSLFIWKIPLSILQEMIL
ncbi:zinc finger protein 106-like [Ostrinia furnacalis]|uniref:zinc finger protein 106-like n=2 Tax=Ostrinia furnacalis TaxID=93504 RepID=UPI0010387D4B|nr:zinc finger protein 106-like [Ostrinia furnacalis]